MSSCIIYLGHFGCWKNQLHQLKEAVEGALVIQPADLQSVTDRLSTEGGAADSMARGLAAAAAEVLTFFFGDLDAVEDLVFFGGMVADKQHND